MGNSKQEVKIGVMQGGQANGFPLCKEMFVPYHSSDLWIFSECGYRYCLNVEFCLNALRVEENQIVLENFFLGADNKKEVVEVLRQLIFRVNQTKYGTVTTQPVKATVPEKESRATRILKISMGFLIGALAGSLITQLILM